MVLRSSRFLCLGTVMLMSIMAAAVFTPNDAQAKRQPYKEKRPLVEEEGSILVPHPSNPSENEPGILVPRWGADVQTAVPRQSVTDTINNTNIIVPRYSVAPQGTLATLSRWTDADTLLVPRSTKENVFDVDRLLVPRSSKKDIFDVDTLLVPRNTRKVRPVNVFVEPPGLVPGQASAATAGIAQPELPAGSSPDPGETLPLKSPSGWEEPATPNTVLPLSTTKPAIDSLPPLEQALVRLEIRFFKHDFSKDDTNTRLSRLEKFVFGTSLPGDDVSRLRKLQNVLQKAIGLPSEESGKALSSSS